VDAARNERATVIAILAMLFYQGFRSLHRRHRIALDRQKLQPLDGARIARFRVDIGIVARRARALAE